MWTTDSNGNYTGNLIAAVKGNSYALESLETMFNQDLNGDGVTGLNPHVIQTDTSSFGSTSLGEIGNNYFLFAAGGTSGPELQYKRAAVSELASLAVGIRSVRCRERMAMRLLGGIPLLASTLRGPQVPTVTTPEI